MTKRVNKIFLIVAVCFLVLSILIPVVDFYMTKAKLLDKGQFTNVQDYILSGTDMATQIQLDIASTSDFYSFFIEEYAATNTSSIMYRAIDKLTTGAFTEVTTWNPLTGLNETLFLFYILDKVLWLFVTYCIFVIPISMVDLFSKAIRKGVEE